MPNNINQLIMYGSLVNCNFAKSDTFEKTIRIWY